MSSTSTLPLSHVLISLMRLLSDPCQIFNQDIGFRSRIVLCLLQTKEYFILQGLIRPDDDEIEKTRKDTQAALDKIVGVKIQAAQPTSLAPQPNAPTYIKYTPAQQGSQYNSGAAQRIIKMQDMPVDPMDPPKFRAKKVSSAFQGITGYKACYTLNQLHM